MGDDVVDDVGGDVATLRWRMGDHRGALAIAFVETGAAMHALAKRVAGADAADVVQEAVLRVWSHPERFDAARATLGAYLLVTTRGTALDHVRKAVRRRLRDERGQREMSLHVETEPVDQELLAQLRAAVNALHDEQRALITIAFIENVAYRQIATRLELPEGTVKSRMRRTLTRLRHDLQPAADNDPS